MGIARIAARRFPLKKFPPLTRPSTSSSTASPSSPPIEKILIANRGEIACRVIRSARNLGIKTVAVYSEVDKNALHVEQADEAVYIGPASARSSYLNASAILNAARRTKAHAIHPGYGFLSENAEFAEHCETKGLIFIGPPASAILDMGDKSASKRIMSEAGVPVVPGYHGYEQDLDFLKEEADRIGYPILVKPAHGGGGKGMRIVLGPDEFAESLLGARREAASSFGNETVLLEKYISRPRHIEVQVFGDKHGNVVHLYERDCSIQRRHQKIIEESPAPNITEELRCHLGQAAVSAAKAVGYYNAGTVEFIMDTLSGQFFFLEMNTRLQVEHPVTEMVIGQDLVEWQIRVANGETLPLNQSQISQSGHAFEARIYAENVPKGFLPAAGLLNHYCPPLASTKVRVETGVKEGDTVSVHYDPMIAKLVVWGENRAAALVKLKDCLSKFQVAGVPTNVNFLQGLAGHCTFSSGQVETNFIEHFKSDLFPDYNEELVKCEMEDAKFGAALAAACLCEHEQVETNGLSKGRLASLWYAAPAFRINHALKRAIQLKWKSERIDMDSIPVGILVTYGKDDMYCVEIEDNSYPGMMVRDITAVGKNNFKLHVDGVTMNVSLAVYSKDSVEHIHIWYGNCHHHFMRDIIKYHDEEDVQTKDKSDTFIPSVKGSVVAPMAGCVVKVLVEDGAMVKKGQSILVLEAMKMEHVVKAPYQGCVRKLQAVVGQQVFDNSILFSIEDK